MAVSLRLLQLEPEELQPYANVFKQMPLRRQVSPCYHVSHTHTHTHVTLGRLVNGTYTHTHADGGDRHDHASQKLCRGQRCQLSGHWNREQGCVHSWPGSLHVPYQGHHPFSPLSVAHTFFQSTILPPPTVRLLWQQLQLESVPIFISASGVYDVEFFLSVGCRDACIYTTQRWDLHKHTITCWQCLEMLLPLSFSLSLSLSLSLSSFSLFECSGRVKFNQFALGSQPCGLLKLEKNIVVGCMDNTLNCYSQKVTRKPLYHVTHWVADHVKCVCMYVCMYIHSLILCVGEEIVVCAITWCHHCHGTHGLPHQKLQSRSLILTTLSSHCT